MERNQEVFLAALTQQQDATWGLSAISRADPRLSNSTYVYDDSAGEGTFCYVLDSGLYLEHDDFEGRATVHDSTGGAETDNAHGTHVAATVGGRRYGVAKKTTLIGVQVTGTEAGQTAWLLDGLQWVANDIQSKGRVGKAIINASLTFPTRNVTNAVNQAFQALIDAGVPVVAAAGNSNDDAANWAPANLPSAITVAASNRNYTRWSFSNWGSAVDLLGPGQDVPSAWVKSPSDEFVTSGTSMAAPHVAGVLAYLTGLEGMKSPAQIKARVLALAKNGITDLNGTPDLLLYNDSGA